MEGWYFVCHNNKFVWKHFVEVCKIAFFLVIPKFWGFKKSTNLFTGFKIHFFLKIGTPEIVKNRFSQKKKLKLNFLKKLRFLTKIAFFEIF